MDSINEYKNKLKEIADLAFGSGINAVAIEKIKILVQAPLIQN